MSVQTNELTPEHTGLHAFNPLSKHNSGARNVMHSSHLGQKLVIEGLEEKIIQSGVEHDFSQYTFNVKMPANGRIIKIIEKYPPYTGLQRNSKTIIIFENDDHTSNRYKEIDYLEVPYYCSMHQFFGFKYKEQPAMSKLVPGAFIAKDTVFADSPGVTENNGYAYGLNLNTAFMTHPSVSEDGIMIAEDVLPRLRFNVFETRVVQFGTKYFPLNLYPNKGINIYKPFPDIGEKIRDDGLLMMLRKYDAITAPVDMSLFDCRETDHIFDRGVYVRGKGGTIVDIEVISNPAAKKQLPDSMKDQISVYEKALLKFHKDIVDTYNQLRYERKKMFSAGELRISDRYHRLVTDSLAIIDHLNKKSRPTIDLTYKKEPVDEYRVVFTIEYTITPNIGFKLTDSSGGKGVICKIAKREDMPVDADGVSADVVVDPQSIANRTNLARSYEHYIAGGARYVKRQLKKQLGINTEQVTTDRLLNCSMETLLSSYDYLIKFYQCVNTVQADYYRVLTQQEKIHHLHHVLNHEATLFVPVDIQKDTPDIVKDIEATFRPTYGPVTYTGVSGKPITTKTKVRIAPIYFMLLEKIADLWSAVSIGKVQALGILAPITKSEKFSYPYRASPTRSMGEAELRIIAGYCGTRTVAEMMDRSNSPATQRNMAWNILTAAKPGNIKNAVDRALVSLGGSKPIQLVKHIFSCMGFKQTFAPEQLDIKQEEPRDGTND